MVFFVMNGSNLVKENEELKKKLAKLQVEYSQLTQVKRQLDEVVTNVPIILYVLDNKGTFILSEGAGLTDLGLKPGQVVGLSVFDVYADYPEIIEAHNKALKGIDTRFSVKIMGTRDTKGNILTEDSYYDARAKPIVTVSGKVESVIGIAYNASHLRRTEQKLTENENRYRTLINESPLGVLVIQQGIVKFANPTFLEILGYNNLDEIYNHQSIEMLAPEMREEMTKRAIRREKGEEVLSKYEVRALKKDGTIIPAFVEARRIIYNDKPSVMLYFRDITEVKKLAEERDQLLKQLQLAQKLESLGIVAGGVAHDFNNLLLGIMGYANLIQAKNTADTEILDYAKEIYNISKEATTLTKQMLAYTGKSVLNQVCTSFNDIIKESEKLINLSVPKSISIRYELSPEVNNIKADINQVKQVILNLVINASEAIGKDIGTIVIKTGLETINDKDVTIPIFDLQIGTYSFVEIRDTGCGIDENTIVNIFDPFYSTKFTGRGLGLSVVQGIIKAHKGSIKIESQLGKGSSFKVLFPITTVNEIVEDKKERQVANIEKTGTVLFVDDDTHIRAIGKKMLEKLGFKPLLVSNGLEAIKLFKEHMQEIILVILDLTMPEMKGSDVLPELRSIAPDVPIIMSSGYNETELEDLFKNQVHTIFLQKPYSLTDLQNTIREIFSS